MTKTETQILGILKKYISSLLTETVLEMAVKRSSVDLDNLRPGDSSRLANSLKNGCRLFITNTTERDKCYSDLDLFFSTAIMSTRGKNHSATIPIEEERDIVIARTEGRNLCAELGFSLSAQVSVATVISELARNIYQYAGNGEIELKILDTDPMGIQVLARDKGPGIEDIQVILDGDYKSKTGMGKGLMAARKLMDEFEIQCDPGMGTTVTIRKYLDSRP